MTETQKAVEQLERALLTNDAPTARATAIRLLEEYPDNPGIKSISGAALIDSGNLLQDNDTLSIGIQLIEELLSAVTDAFEPSAIKSLQYNLSNGYAARAQLPSTSAEETAADSRTARALLRGLMLDLSDLSYELRPRALTNYGNLLDSVGRTFEAIDCYAEADRVCPRHAAAAANCGMSLRYVVPVTGRHQARNLFEAWDRLHTACGQRDGLIRESGHHLVEGVAAALKKLEGEVEEHVEGGLEGLKKLGASHRAEHGCSSHPWTRMAGQDRLFLTFNQFPGPCTAEQQDDAFFNKLMVSLGANDTRFQALTHALNHFKEDFSTARYLFYSAIHDSEKVTAVSRATLYGETTDFARFGLASGLLKASLRVSADALDKLAVFANEYLRLGHDVHKIDFRKVWHESLDPRKPHHPKVQEVAERNRFMHALLELKRDWFYEEHSSRLRAARNAASHRGIVLYMMGPLSQETTDAWNFDQFTGAVLMALRTTRAAGLYLISVVLGEETRMENEIEGLIAPLTFRLRPGLGDD